MKTFWEKLIHILFIVCLSITTLLLLFILIMSIILIWNDKLNIELYTNLIYTSLIMVAIFGIPTIITGVYEL
jgi:hypothetical protein